MSRPTAAQLKNLIDVGGDHPVTITVGGARGTGRTHLLSELKQLLRASGVLVLSARPESALDPALSAFHQLFSPASRHLARLAAPGRAVLEEALGLLKHAAGSRDPASLAKAASALLGLLTDEQAVALLIDDWDRLDELSIAVLDRLTIALPGRTHVVRAATGGSQVVTGTGHLVQLLPWDLTRSERFLDGMKDRPRGQLRHQILMQAHGNPLALAELTRHLSRRPELRTPPGVPLPLSEHLLAAFAPGIARLTPPARWLLAMAAASRGDVADLVAASGLPAETVHGHAAAAQQAGLVIIRDGRLHFAHEMTRAAAYHGISSTDMRRIHGMLGSTARGEPWRAWHAMAAAGEPDEAAASCLERSAVRLTVASAPVAATYALLAAAAGSRDDIQRTRRTLLPQEPRGPQARPSGPMNWPSRPVPTRRTPTARLMSSS